MLEFEAYITRDLSMVEYVKVCYFGFVVVSHFKGISELWYTFFEFLDTR